MTSRNNTPKTEARAGLREQCQWEWRGVGNTVAFKDKDKGEFEVFGAKLDHNVNCGYFLVGSHYNTVLGITILISSPSKTHMVET